MVEREILTITLKDVPIMGGENGETQLRLVIENENSRYDIGIDFDDGYSQAAEDVQDVVLGLMARWIDWEHEIKTLHS